LQIHNRWVALLTGTHNLPRHELSHPVKLLWHWEIFTVLPHDAMPNNKSSAAPVESETTWLNPVANQLDGRIPNRIAVPGVGGPLSLAGGPDTLAMLAALKRRWVTIVLLGLTLGLLTACACWFALKPRYTGFSQISVSWADPSIIEPLKPGDFKIYLQTTAGKIASRKVISAALRRDEVKRINLLYTDPDPTQSIQDDLRVEFKENSELMTIYFTHSDPVVARTVANAIKEAFMEEVVYVERNARTSKVNELEKFHSEAVKQLETKKENLRKVAQNLGGVDPLLAMDQRQEARMALRDAKAESTRIGYRLIETRSNLEAIEARIKEEAARAANRGMTGAPTGPDENTLYEAALEQLVAADGQYSKLEAAAVAMEETIASYQRKGFPEDYLAIRNSKEKLSHIRNLLDRRMEYLSARARKTVAAEMARANRPDQAVVPGGRPGEDLYATRIRLQKELEALTRLGENLDNSIKELTAQAVKTPSLSAEYETLSESIKILEKGVSDLYAKLEREKLELRAAPRITSYQHAELLRLDNRKQLLATGVGFFAVFGVTGLGIAWMDCRKRRICNLGDVSRGLGLRVIGVVPHTPKLQQRILNSKGESDLEGTPVMESIDAIRTRLIREAQLNGTRVIMVTSAGFGEGKTSLAIGLASSLARAGRKTLLFDGDLRHSSIHTLFDIPEQPGLSEVLIGETEITEVACEGPLNNLSVITAGQLDREVLLSLSRDGMEGIFEKLSQEFDFIIVDSHPILEANDSLLIGRHVDAVLLTVLKEVSELPRVYAAQQQMMSLGIRLMGAVVCGANPEDLCLTN